MKIALMGMPQSGKKTLFFVLTGRQVPETSKPGETVEGRALIRDPRVDKLVQLAKPDKITYAENIYVLCPDVTDDERRGWIEAARRCDLLCWLVRGFASETVYHPRGSVDTERDRRNLEAETVFADLELVEKRLERIAKENRGGRTQARMMEEKTLQKLQGALENGVPARTVALLPAENEAVRSLGLITQKPFLWLINVDEREIGNPPPSADYVVSCGIEKEIMAIGDAGERDDFLRGIGLAAPGIDRINAAAYEALGLISFYTIGADEVRAWTITRGSSAPVAGGKVHTDIERGFIRVEIIAFDDLLSAGSETAAKQQGKMHLRGRDYIMQDGDIAHFLFNV